MKAVCVWRLPETGLKRLFIQIILLLRKVESEHNLGESSAEKKLSYNLLMKPQRLDLVSRFVKENKGRIIPFEKQQDFQLRICDLDETFYAGQSDMLEDWEVLYLPKPVKMEVLGIVDDVPCLATGQQLVILVADNGSVYAYEEELLHRVGKTLQEFLRDGLWLFRQEVYACAKDLEPKSEEEWVKDPEIKQIRQSTRDFIKSKEEAFGKHLDFLSNL
ncbi:uncharacterized protein LOC101932092 isoform X1 [Chrysemys picta bellii]|uniref:uncharacterized protein LOC101932092 isoform X1 n=1 Tax=Chrysemys picta bellii TaxID=8478 RepID=UPI001C669E5A|nr:uncharacterized protein LOC101932092 isoform X1 [Chrysemys picta bellii]